MHRVDGANPGPGNSFVEGDPQAGTPATQITGKWLTADQEEILAPVEALGLTPTDADNTQLLQAMNLMARPRRPWLNALINSDFTICQRFSPAGVSLTVGQVAYTVDRWRASPGTGGAAACTVQPGQQTNADQLLHGSRNALYINQSAAGTVPFLEQRIEDVRTFAGQVVVLSFWADLSGLGSGTTLAITPKFVQNFGPAGSADVTTVGTTINVPLAGGFARYEVSVTIPSIAGKTWNTTTIASFDNYLAVRLEFQSAVTFQIALASAQFQLGAVASDYQVPNELTEYRRCQRYYQTSAVHDWIDKYQGASQVGAICGANSGVEARSLAVHFAVPMRKIPTVTWASSVSPFSAGKIYWNAAERAVTGTNYTSVITPGSPVIAASQAMSDVEGHYFADAEL